jgi:histidyl-tRNA synthetase
MRDLLPAEMDRVRTVEDAFVRTCAAWGYREVRTPLIEQLHLFTAAGTLSPQTLDRVYSFLDWDGWSGERVVLRPDSTIPAARLYAERLDGGRVAKLFYTQNVFRFTADGSSREEWQCGVELFGDTGLAGDVELLMLAVAALAAAGAPAPSISLSHAGLVRAILAAAGMSADEQSAAYDRLLEGDLAVVDEVEARLPQLNAALRLLFEVDGSGSGYIANLREALVGPLPQLARPIDDLSFVVAALEAAGLTPHIHAVLARSFEYYSGIVTRLECDGRLVGSGGRYDELVGLVGGRSVPASGFALYVGAVADLLSERAPSRQDRILASAEGDAPATIAAAHAAAAALRERGLHVETVEGADTAPTHRLSCRTGSPRFELTWPDGQTQAFERLDDVVRVLEHDR